MYIAIVVITIIILLFAFVNKSQKIAEERYIQPPLHDGLCISELPASITVFRHGKAVFRANKQCVFYTDKPGIVGIECDLMIFGNNGTPVKLLFKSFQSAYAKGVAL